MSYPIFFIHIPKTAGTSFRKTAEKHYGADQVICDYGIHSAETSAILKQQGPDNLDLWLTLQQILGVNPALIVGHVGAMRYAPLIPTRNITTLVREPLIQALSHFNHFRRHHSYTGGFPEFIREPRFTNLQSRILQGVPIKAFGLLGLTNQFSAYIEQFNALFCTELSEMTLNTATNLELTTATVMEQDKQDFLTRNEADIYLYRAVSALVEQRTAFAQAPAKWTHGDITHIKDRVVTGWAWHSGTDEPVMVECLIENEVIDCKPAIEFCGHLRILKVPRGGYVGFSFKIADVSTGSNVTCRTRDTGQVFARDTFA